MRHSYGTITCLLALFVAGCASVDNQPVKVTEETNAIVVPEDDGEQADVSHFECERVYRVVVAHTYELEQELTGQDGKLLLGAQTVAGTLLKLATSEERADDTWRHNQSTDDFRNESAAASLGVIAAALSFVEAESKRKAREEERQPATLYTDEERLMRIQHCLDIAKITDRDAQATARRVRRKVDGL